MDAFCGVKVFKTELRKIFRPEQVSVVSVVSLSLCDTQRVSKVNLIELLHFQEKCKEITTIQRNLAMKLLGNCLTLHLSKILVVIVCTRPTVFRKGKFPLKRPY